MDQQTREALTYIIDIMTYIFEIGTHEDDENVLRKVAIVREWLDKKSK